MKISKWLKKNTYSLKPTYIKVNELSTIDKCFKSNFFYVEHKKVETSKIIIKAKSIKHGKAH